MKKKNNLNIVINVSIIVTYLIFFALVLILFTGIGTVDKAIIRGGVLFLVGILFIVLASIFRKKHPTILYGYEQIKEKLKTNNELKAKIKKLKNEIKK